VARVAVQIDGVAVVAYQPGIDGPAAFAAVLGIGLQVRAGAQAAGPARRAFVFAGAAVGCVAVQVHAAGRAAELSGRAGLSANTAAALFICLAGVAAFSAVLPVHLQKNTLLPALLHPGWAVGQAQPLVTGLVGIARDSAPAAMVRVAGGIDAGVAATQLAGLAICLLIAAGADHQRGTGQQNGNYRRGKTGVHEYIRGFIIADH
jgi:hypothetical protein